MQFLQHLNVIENKFIGDRFERNNSCRGIIERRFIESRLEKNNPYW